MSTSTTQAAKQIDQLTFTRFIAAVTVVYYHYGQKTFPFNISFFDNLFLVGNISVSFFYALSGFIMTVVYYREPGRQFGKVKYWQARFARIYPVYVLALVSTVFLLNPQRDAVWKQVFSSLMIQSWVPGYPMSYNAPGWSVSVEMFFYILFPFLIVSFAKTNLKKLCFAVGLFWFSSSLLHISASTFLPIKPPSGGYDFLYYLPWLHLNTFLCGMLCGVGYLKYGNLLTERKRLNTSLFYAATAVVVAILLCRKLIEQLVFHLALTNGIMAPLFLLVIVTLSCDRTFVSRIMSARLCVLLGDASYSMYILHVPIYLAFQKILTSCHLVLSKGAALQVYVAVVIVLSLLSYLLIERPARNGLKLLFEARVRVPERDRQTAPITG